MGYRGMSVLKIRPRDAAITKSALVTKAKDEGRYANMSHIINISQTINIPYVYIYIYIYIKAHILPLMQLVSLSLFLSPSISSSFSLSFYLSIYLSMNSFFYLSRRN